MRLNALPTSAAIQLACVIINRRSQASEASTHKPALTRVSWPTLADCEILHAQKKKLAVDISIGRREVMHGKPDVADMACAA